MVVGGPWTGTVDRVGVVTVKVALIMKFVPLVPCETSTKVLPEDGTGIVVPAGIAPPAVEVNVVAVPLGHAAALERKQYA